MWYEFKFVMFCFWGEKNDQEWHFWMFMVEWRSAEWRYRGGFLVVGIHVHQLKPNPQLWYLCACLNRTQWSSKKHFLYKLHISFIYCFFPPFFLLCNVTQKNLLQCSGHKRNYCISLTSYTVLECIYQVNHKCFNSTMPFYFTWGV